MMQNEKDLIENEMTVLQQEILSAIQTQQQNNKMLSEIWQTRASVAYQEADKRILPVFEQYCEQLDTLVKEQGGSSWWTRLKKRWYRDIV